MSVNYSQYPATGVFSENLGIYMRTAQDIYNDVGGFGRPVDKGIALSWSTYHLAGGTFYLPDASDITQSTSFSLHFNPSLSANNKVYNVLTSCVSDVTLYDNAVQGYNNQNRVYPEITTSTRYTLNGVAVRYLSDYEPSRFFEFMYAQNACQGFDGEWIDFREAWLHMDDVANPHYWTTGYRELFTSKTIVAINTATTVNAYDTIAPVTSRFTKMTRMIDNNYTTSIFCRNWSSELFSIIFNSDGDIANIIYPTGYDGDSDFNNSLFYVFGNMPKVRIYNMKTLTSSLFENPQDGVDYQFLYFDGVAYKNDNGVFVDMFGKQLEGDVEKGALYFDVWWRSGQPYRVNIFACHHVKSILKTLCSSGIPVRTPQSISNGTPLNARNPQNTEVSQFYQTKINSRTGEVRGEPKPLYEPENIQLIGNAGEIELSYTENIVIDETPLETPDLYYIGNGVRTYALTKPNLDTYFTNLFGLPDDIVDLIQKYTANIAEVTRNIMVFPFSVPNYTTTVAGNIVVHGSEIVENASEIRKSTCIIKAGSYFVESNNSFTDYEPYSNYYIFIPYVGFTKLESRDVVNHAISIQYVVDFNTGACEACIFRDGVILKTLQGIMGVNIPIVSRDYSQMLQNITSVVANSANAVKSIIAMDWKNALLNSGSATFDLQSSDISRNTTSETSTAGTSNNFVLPQYPFIIRIKAKAQNPDNYASTIGHACNVSGTLSEFTGYTVCRNVVIDNVIATSEECDMIKSLLESGVYI